MTLVIAIVIVSALGFIGHRYWREPTSNAANVAAKLPGPQVSERPVAPAKSEANVAKCSGVESPAGSRVDLSLGHQTGTCVGWMIEYDGSNPFGSTDVSINGVISSILRENKRVRELDEHAEHRIPYIRIALLMPMTYREGSAMSSSEILHALQGAHTLQMQANQPLEGEIDLEDNRLLVQIVLANEGPDQSEWEPAIEKLFALNDANHPLTAVVGLGISIEATKLAVEKLATRDIPAIGAVITADDMVAKGFFKLSPSTTQYARSVAEFLGTKNKYRSGYLVFDHNKDSYVESLRASFIRGFPQYTLEDHSSSFAGVVGASQDEQKLFSPIVTNICLAKPDIIFFAGRSRDLPEFVRALRRRASCDSSPVVKDLLIVTGTTSVNLSDKELRDARVGVLRASGVDPMSWSKNGPDAPRGYNSFRLRFKSLSFADDDLIDGYAVMHRDAAAAALIAARRFFAADENKGKRLPTVKDTRNALFGNQRKFPLASGDIYFKELPANDLWAVGKLVPIVRIGDVAKAITPARYATYQVPPPH